MTSSKRSSSTTCLVRSVRHPTQNFLNKLRVPSWCGPDWRESVSPHQILGPYRFCQQEKHNDKERMKSTKFGAKRTSSWLLLEKSQQASTAAEKCELYYSKQYALFKYIHICVYYRDTNSYMMQDARKRPAKRKQNLTASHIQ